MSTSGQHISSLLTTKLANTGASLQSFQAKRLSHQRSVQLLLAKNQQLFNSLAALKLPALDEKLVDKLDSGVREQVFALVEEQEQSLANTILRLEEIEIKIDQLNELQAQRVPRLDELADKRDELEALVQKNLASNQLYNQTKLETEQRAAQIHRDCLRLEELQEQSSEKIPDYRQNPIFEYLVDSNYGTNDYKASRIVRFLDKWAARKIDFNSQVINYRYLLSTPELVELEIKQREESLQGLLAKLEKLEKEEFDKTGLSEVIDEGIQLGTKRQETETELATLAAEEHELRKMQTSLSSLKGSHYQRALVILREHLAAQSNENLEHSARLSSSKVDDNIIAKIQEIESTLADSQKQLEKILAEEKKFSHTRYELQQLQRRFLSKDFDSNYSRFSSRLNPVKLFNDLGAGAFGIEDAWNLIVSSQSFIRQARQSAFSSRDISNIIEGTLNQRRSYPRSRRRDNSGIFDSARRMGTVFGSRRGGGSFSSGEGF